jgi:hypothetical protein
MPRIKIKRGTTSQWNSSTTPLLSGELGLDTTLNKLKAGNGSSLWTNLPFLTSDGGGDTGDITFDGVQIIGAGTASGDGYGNGTIELVPDADINTDQYLIIDPTAPNHIHIRGGGTQDASGADVFIGGERNNVRVSDGGRSVSISTRPETVINTYTNLNETSNTSFIVSSTANIYVGDTMYYPGGDIVTVDSVTENSPSTGLQTITANLNGSPASFVAGEPHIFSHEEEWENYWQFGADGVLAGPGGGTLIVSGISGEPGDDVFAIVADQNLVLQHGVGGAYLNDSTIANNHIATMGDITAANEYTDDAVAGLGNSLPESYVPLSDVGVADGVASLDENGKIPDSEIPDGIARDSELFSGSYDDLSNKPTIPSLEGYATETYVTTAVSNLVDAAPTTLNTLNELAAALGDDANYASTISTALGNKLDSNYVTIGNTLLDGISGQTYGLIGTSAYLDVKNTNGYNKEIELDIAAVESRLDTDGYVKQTALDAKSNILVTTNAQSSNYTIDSADAGKLIEMSGGGTLTITDSSSFPVGFYVDVLQTGTSQVTLAGTSFTPNATPGLKLRTQWSSATLIKRALNSWVVLGDLSA